MNNSPEEDGRILVLQNDEEGNKVQVVLTLSHEENCELLLESKDAHCSRQLPNSEILQTAPSESSSKEIDKSLQVERKNLHGVSKIVCSESLEPNLPSADLCSSDKLVSSNSDGYDKLTNKRIASGGRDKDGLVLLEAECCNSSEAPSDAHSITVVPVSDSDHNKDILETTNDADAPVFGETDTCDHVVDNSSTHRVTNCVGREASETTLSHSAIPDEIVNSPITKKQILSDQAAGTEPTEIETRKILYACSKVVGLGPAVNEGKGNVLEVEKGLAVKQSSDNGIFCKDGDSNRVSGHDSETLTLRSFNIGIRDSGVESGVNQNKGREMSGPGPTRCGDATEVPHEHYNVVHSGLEHCNVPMEEDECDVQPHVYIDVCEDPHERDSDTTSFSAHNSGEKSTERYCNEMYDFQKGLHQSDCNSQALSHKQSSSTDPHPQRVDLKNPKPMNTGTGECYDTNYHLYGTQSFRSLSDQSYNVGVKNSKSAIVRPDSNSTDLSQSSLCSDGSHDNMIIGNQLDFSEGYDGSQSSLSSENMESVRAHSTGNQSVTDDSSHLKIISVVGRCDHVEDVTMDTFFTQAMQSESIQTSHINTSSNSEVNMGKEIKDSSSRSVKLASTVEKNLSKEPQIDTSIFPRSGNIDVSTCVSDVNNLPMINSDPQNTVIKTEPLDLLEYDNGGFDNTSYQLNSESCTKYDLVSLSRDYKQVSKCLRSGCYKMIHEHRFLSAINHLFSYLTFCGLSYYRVRLRCGICYKPHMIPSSLVKHFSSCHSIVEETCVHHHDEIISSMFLCTICYLYFPHVTQSGDEHNVTGRYLLNAHLNNHSITSRVYRPGIVFDNLHAKHNLFCSLCFAKFRDMVDLKSHVETHESMLQVSCEEAKKDIDTFSKMNDFRKYTAVIMRTIVDDSMFRVRTGEDNSGIFSTLSGQSDQDVLYIAVKEYDMHGIRSDNQFSELTTASSVTDPSLIKYKRKPRFLCKKQTEPVSKCNAVWNQRNLRVTFKTNQQGRPRFHVSHKITRRRETVSEGSLKKCISGKESDKNLIERRNKEKVENQTDEVQYKRKVIQENNKLLVVISDNGFLSKKSELKRNEKSVKRSRVKRKSMKQNFENPEIFVQQTAIKSEPSQEKNITITKETSKILPFHNPDTGKIQLKTRDKVRKFAKKEGLIVTVSGSEFTDRTAVLKETVKSDTDESSRKCESGIGMYMPASPSVTNSAKKEKNSQKRHFKYQRTQSNSKSEMELYNLSRPSVDANRLLKKYPKHRNKNLKVVLSNILSSHKQKHSSCASNNLVASQKDSSSPSLSANRLSAKRIATNVKCRVCSSPPSASRGKSNSVHSTVVKKPVGRPKKKHFCNALIYKKSKCLDSSLEKSETTAQLSEHRTIPSFDEKKEESEQRSILSFDEKKEESGKQVLISPDTETDELLCHFPLDSAKRHYPMESDRAICRDSTDSSTDMEILDKSFPTQEVKDISVPIVEKKKRGRPKKVCKDVKTPCDLTWRTATLSLFYNQTKLQYQVERVRNANTLALKALKDRQNEKQNNELNKCGVCVRMRDVPCKNVIVLLSDILKRDSLESERSCLNNGSHESGKRIIKKVSKLTCSLFQKKSRNKTADICFTELSPSDKYNEKCLQEENSHYVDNRLQDSLSDGDSVSLITKNLKRKASDLTSDMESVAEQKSLKLSAKESPGKQKSLKLSTNKSPHKQKSPKSFAKDSPDKQRSLILSAKESPGLKWSGKYNLNVNLDSGVRNVDLSGIMLRKKPGPKKRVEESLDIVLRNKRKGKDRDGWLRNVILKNGRIKKNNLKTVMCCDDNKKSFASSMINSCEELKLEITIKMGKKSMDNNKEEIGILTEMRKLNSLFRMEPKKKYRSEKVKKLISSSTAQKSKCQMVSVKRLKKTSPCTKKMHRKKHSKLQVRLGRNVFQKKLDFLEKNYLQPKITESFSSEKVSDVHAHGPTNNKTQTLETPHPDTTVSIKQEPPDEFETVEGSSEGTSVPNTVAATDKLQVSIANSLTKNVVPHIILNEQGIKKIIPSNNVAHGYKGKYSFNLNDS